MAAFSNYLEDQIIGWAFSGATFATLPTAGTVWVSLHTADPSETGASEVTGGNYARISVAAAGWTKTTAGTGIGGFDSFYNFAEALSPLGNASADACADYIVTMFSDLTRMVTMQNLFHDGGFSYTGISQDIVDKLQP